MDYKIILGIIATIIAFVSYIPYARDIFFGRTKPHALSWFIWATLTSIGFFGQVAGNGGAGTWVTGFTAFVCFIIFFVALLKGEKKILFVDWLCLLGSAIAIALWYMTKDPLVSVILVTIIYAFGFIPTFRKSFMKPKEETVSTYLLSGIKFVFALVALTNFSVVTVLFPVSLIFMNWAFVIMTIMRKKQLYAHY